MDLPNTGGSQFIRLFFEVLPASANQREEILRIADDFGLVKAEDASYLGTFLYSPNGGMGAGIFASAFSPRPPTGGLALIS